MKRKREYSSFFYWPKKEIAEWGAVETFLETINEKEHMMYVLKNLKPKNQLDPPDCIVKDNNGHLIAIEVTELVCRKTIEKTIKMGNNYYREWSPEQVISAINNIIAEKDKKKLNGGPYDQYILLIHTDEPIICSTIYQTNRDLLENNIYHKPTKINQVYFLTSYDPAIKSYSYIKIKW
jgi:CRISPR/Cas system CMR subunit Cmr4 (Cas7 group RAMP superfamily)